MRTKLVKLGEDELQWGEDDLIDFLSQYGQVRIENTRLYLVRHDYPLDQRCSDTAIPRMFTTLNASRWNFHTRGFSISEGIDTFNVLEAISNYLSYLNKSTKEKSQRFP